MKLAETRLADGRQLVLREAGVADAEALVTVITAAFGERPPVDPPPPALSETPASVTEALAHGFGVVAELAGAVVGTIIVRQDAQRAWITRVSVLPEFQRHGVASTMVEVVLELLAEWGSSSADLIAREEFPAVVAWWRRHGFQVVDAEGTRLHLARPIPICLEVPTAEAMQDLGRRLAPLLGPGDLIIASGDLGAGKTTFTQGLGAGLGVDGPVISPTFVLARIHPATEGVTLVHVDAYRLGSLDELEDLDLPVEESVTLVEWGRGVAEGLTTGRLELDIRRTTDPDDETRWVFLTPIGGRWEGARSALEGLA